MDGPLSSGWALYSTPAGEIEGPLELPQFGDDWRPAMVPGTVAASLGLGPGADIDLDGRDWWYRCVFPCVAGEASKRLRFEGLATLAEVWLNGTHLLSSRNMFVERSCEVTALLRGQNELVICFRALSSELAAKRPRPRWKTALVEHQNLRWIRTTLLGRIPGWTPKLPPIGPWRAIHLEPLPLLKDLRLRTELDGSDGVLRVSAELDTEVTSASLEVGNRTFELECRDRWLGGEFRISDVPLWWPHTHGSASLLECAISLVTVDGARRIPCGRIGFRSVRWDWNSGQLVVNGRPIFARGACWTGEGMATEDSADLARSLDAAREAGANMLRVGGTMTYGSERFYALCDELGILVWQDFMFANMDYPFQDPGFAAEAEEEVVAVLKRLRAHPCVAVYCGGSEIQQQAAMLGLQHGERAIPFFEETLPALCSTHHPGVPYVPGTPYGGVLPFQTGTGICHYYGVGAYRRPLEDVRRAQVKFTAECLGFSNVPDAEAVERMLKGSLPVPHLPAWKAGVPRDNGAGWDFEDIRDHYLQRLFGVDPIALRSSDPHRYLELSRVVTGETMLRVFAEWRRPESACGGGLVWFWRDLRPGAGWGLLDSAGRPKTAWWYLRRAWARRAVLFTDEGLDGLALHVLNESDAPLAATVELELLKGGRQGAGLARSSVEVGPFSSVTLSGEAMLGGFADLTYAYRFGPPRHDVVIARLRDGNSELLHQDVYFPLGHGLPVQDAGALSAVAQADEDGSVLLTLRSDAFLQAVTIACAGYTPSDNAFHLCPGLPRSLRMVPEGASRKTFKAHVAALNLDGSVTVRA